MHYLANGSNKVLTSTEFKYLLIGRYDLTIPLDAIGYKMLHGHKIVINVCCAYWPMIWTPRRCTNISIKSGKLTLPVIQDIDKFKTPDLLASEPKYGPALDMEVLRESSYKRDLIYGLSSKLK